MKFLAIVLPCFFFTNPMYATKSTDEPKLIARQELDNGKVLSLTTLTPSVDTYSFKLSGFGPKENVTITSKSCDESIILKMITNESGELVSSLDPQIGDALSGKGSLEVKTKDNEKLFVDFDWKKNIR
jgi:hypothetical protein